jgi:hypothetical protein
MVLKLKGLKKNTAPREKFSLEGNALHKLFDVYFAGYDILFCFFHLIQDALGNLVLQRVERGYCGTTRL